MHPEHFHRVFFAGIGGIGMSALARWFASKGKPVAGYDKTPSRLTGELEDEGLALHFQDDPQAIPEEFRDPASTLVIYTPALPKDHRELAWFRQEGFQLRKRSEVLGQLTEKRFTVAVAGTHGKTTTTALVAHLLMAAGKPFTAFVGGVLKGYESNFLHQDGPEAEEVMVVEADEYDRSFLRLHPNLAVITSADPDHLDIYNTPQEMYRTFGEFAAQTQQGGILFLKAGLKEKILELNTYSYFKIQEYSLTWGDFLASEIGASNRAFSFRFHDTLRQKEAPMQLPLPGYHNVENALAALAVGFQLGLAEDVLQKGLSTFPGIRRRFDILISRPEVALVDDYAHHPAELRALVESVRKLFPERKITVAFQPHLYTRTRDFLEGFGQSLSLADEVVLVELYPAREEPLPGISEASIEPYIANTPCHFSRKADLPQTLHELSTDVVLIVGAGDIDRTVEPVKQMLETQYNLLQP